MRGVTKMLAPLNGGVGAIRIGVDRLGATNAIRDGGGNGSIIGRNTFQRPRDQALKLLDGIIRIYKGEA